MHLRMFAASSLSQSFLYPRTQLPDLIRMDSILWTSQREVQNASDLSIFIYSFPFFGTQKCFLVNLSWSSTPISNMQHWHIIAAGAFLWKFKSGFVIIDFVIHVCLGIWGLSRWISNFRLWSKNPSGNASPRNQSGTQHLDCTTLWKRFRCPVTDFLEFQEWCEVRKAPKAPCYFGTKPYTSLYLSICMGKTMKNWNTFIQP